MEKKGDDKLTTLIEAQASSLPSLAKGESFVHLVAKLTAATATEMRVQKGYESDGEKAQKQAEWINDFKMDLILEAFSQYCQSDEVKPFLDPIKAIKEFSTPKQVDFRFTPGVNDNTDMPEWAARFYIFLHFIPVDEVNLLYQQFLKWGALRAKAAKTNETSMQHKDDAVDILKQIMRLYCKMHDDKMSGMMSDENQQDQRIPFESDLYADFYENKQVMYDALGLQKNGLWWTMLLIIITIMHLKILYVVCARLIDMGT